MIFDDIAKANIDALKARDKVARGIYSVVYGKFKEDSIDKGLGAKSLPDPDCVRIIQKTIKELEEEYNTYASAGRNEQADEIKRQKELLTVYLPKMMSEDEIRAEIEKLEDKKIPSVMKHFKANFDGKCEMAVVSKVAKEFN